MASHGTGGSPTKSMTGSPIRTMTGTSSSQQMIAFKETTYPKFVGRLQRTNKRKPGKPPVDFAKGGSDFRTPHNTSTIGRQVVYESASSIRFGDGSRFDKSDTIGIGPAGLGQVSSMRKQVISKRQSAGSMTFGTSIREDEMKQYSLYTCMRR